MLITHGTDTLEETAFFLHQSLSVSCPVVLVSAMRPASSAFADGPANLHDAMALLAHDGVTGVCAVSAGKVHGAPEVQKMYPYQIDAFSSGETGPLALVEEGRIRRVRPWQAPVGQASLALDLGRTPWPRVEIVSSHAGCTGDVVRALVAASTTTNPLAGLVLAATGNGTVHQDLEAALLQAQDKGVKVVRSSRCALAPWWRVQLQHLKPYRACRPTKPVLHSCYAY